MFVRRIQKPNEHTTSLCTIRCQRSVTQGAEGAGMKQSVKRGSWVVLPISNTPANFDGPSGKLEKHFKGQLQRLYWRLERWLS